MFQKSWIFSTILLYVLLKFVPKYFIYFNSIPDGIYFLIMFHLLLLVYRNTQIWLHTLRPWWIHLLHLREVHLLWRFLLDLDTYNYNIYKYNFTSSFWYSCLLFIFLALIPWVDLHMQHWIKMMWVLFLHCSQF